MFTKKSQTKRDSTEMATLDKEIRKDKTNVRKSIVNKCVRYRNQIEIKENQTGLKERSIDKVLQALVKRPLVSLVH